jgi:hypothetical protein
MTVAIKPVLACRAKNMFEPSLSAGLLWFAVRKTGNCDRAQAAADNINIAFPAGNQRICAGHANCKFLGGFIFDANQE